MCLHCDVKSVMSQLIKSHKHKKFKWFLCNIFLASYNLLFFNENASLKESLYSSLYWRFIASMIMLSIQL